MDPINLALTSRHTLYRVTELGQPRGDYDGLLANSVSTLPLQMFLHVTVETFNQIVQVGNDGSTTFSGPTRDPFPIGQHAWFHASSFMCKSWICLRISDLLHRLEIEARDQGNMVDDIHKAGMEIMDNPSNLGRKVLPLYVTVRRTRVRLVDEMALRAVRDSMRESEEGRRSGMIPAAKSAMYTMLKYARVERKKPQLEEGDSDYEGCCPICLEEYSEGSIASKMPCSHVFHPFCIRKWLRKSHNCPLCRFEMPTS